MRVVIIEDEALAVEKLTKMLLSYDKQLQVEATLTSVDEAVAWLQTHPAPDLLLVDIHLEDGLCFEIFKKVTVDSPVIFTTAYDQYAIKAFQVHSVDYLLKPIQYEKLAQSLDKFKALQARFHPPVPQLRLDDLAKLINADRNTYKSRFLVKAGARIRAIKSDEIAYIFTEQKTNLLVTRDGLRYPVDYSLDELCLMLDTNLFFRVNRQLVIHIDSAAEIHPYFKGRLKLGLYPPLDMEVIISSDRTPLFKEWLGK
ncbi:LytR/AlgR family response regulator transcription factor [Rufibacter tibetensis]|uniref:LytTR family transcriptional regulator n=1 Tax=Rufibacter tibetensis TaxID=512763 RepID=A0A0P0D1R7_9BACT|nr:LytTR family DNA-binding domain-containing protein [Rufibacter tibetensis]ALJ01722.1 LytTR family transcriptional regulator [Rufibacter tibetensis]